MSHRKPTAKKILEGNPGKRPLNLREPKLGVLDVGFDTPPDELGADPVAASEWRRMAPILRRSKAVTPGDRGALLSLCQQWSRYLEANRSVATAGMVVRSPSGYPMPNPYIAIANRSLGNCIKLWVELGMTPSARSKVIATGDPSADDVFAELDLSLNDSDAVN